MNETTLLESLEHGSHQRESEKETGVVSLSHEANKYVSESGLG